jgi:hypothetical protein
MDREAVLRRTYDAFNARDIDAVLAHLSDDVDWPTAWVGGWVHGHAGVREYWERQWREIDPHVSPVAFADRPGGRVAVTVDAVVRDRDGRIMSEGRVTHVYSFEGDVVTRMDVEGAQG